VYAGSFQDWTGNLNQSIQVRIILATMIFLTVVMRGTLVSSIAFRKVGRRNVPVQNCLKG
jgi:hypothetical protein